MMVDQGLARSGTEANRLIKQGVYVGGCTKDCGFFTSGKCDCGGWKKVTNPLEEIEKGLVVKVGNGNWRLMNREGGGWDQVVSLTKR